MSDFSRGDIVTIKPIDSDDPVANDFSGQMFKFVTDHATSLIPNVVVEDENGKRLHFRESDIKTEWDF